MRTLEIDALGDTCPIPVVKTKNAISELMGEAGIIEILVDNEIAVQNLLKMSNIKGYESSFNKQSKFVYRVKLVIGGV